MAQELNAEHSSPRVALDDFRKLLSEVIQVDANRLSPEVRLSALGVDSVAAADICATIEHEYDVVIPVEALREDLRIVDLYHLLLE